MSSDAPERLLYFPVVSGKGVSRPAKQAASDEATAPSDASDEALIERAQKRDSDAVGLLFDRHARLVFRIGLRILRDRGEAEDLVQDFFLRLWERASTFDAQKGSARTWIVQVAYRRAFDQRARLTRRHFYAGTDLAGAENAIQETTGLDDQVIRQVTGKQLRAIFGQLSEKQRRTLELYFFEGLSLREIAGELGDTLENTRHYYYRGLEQLRRGAIALGLGGERQSG